MIYSLSLEHELNKIPENAINKQKNLKLLYFIVKWISYYSVIREKMILIQSKLVTHKLTEYDIYHLIPSFQLIN